MLTVSFVGSLTELMGDLEGAMNAYEQALRHNQWSISAMNAISCILRTKEQFPKAIEYLQNILKLDPSNGETWGSLGHCHLMMDNLQEAYTSYQQALYHLRDPKVSRFPLASSLEYQLLIPIPPIRNPSCGMESVSCMIAMVLWTTRKRLSRK
jgi:tetratricopeptide (TPR) repeat protein